MDPLRKKKPIVPPKLFLVAMLIACSCSHREQNGNREEISLSNRWKFIRGEVKDGAAPGISTENWKTVEVPHDWAINEPFDRDHDLSIVKGKERPGHTGGLPHVGVGWYRKLVTIPEMYRDRKVFVEFDGAMSHARIYCNGDYIGERPYGYISFGFEVTGHIRFGEENLIAVRLENPRRMSTNWYPGAGIYRHARLVLTDPVHIPRWGTYITTPDIAEGKGTVVVQTNIVNGSTEPENIRLVTELYDPNDRIVATVKSSHRLNAGDSSTVMHTAEVADPGLWSTKTPVLYRARSILKKGSTIVDVYHTRFGFRYFTFDKDQGFSLNGIPMKLNGVSLMHHDLGPLGTAVNRAAIERQLRIMQEMGANAIRTCHNPPAPELLELCDSMGFLVMNEAFESWRKAKSSNDYSKLFDRWAEEDLVSFIRRDRNHPSVILWSIGNEIGDQRLEDGWKTGRFLTEICHREDPTRPVTQAFNNHEDALKNGLMHEVDIVGLNYATGKYMQLHKDHPDFIMFGSETGCTVSSRGEYFPPPVPGIARRRKDRFHLCSYDMGRMNFGALPDEEFAAQDSFEFIAGTFIWTGLDYMGEPKPYSQEWPARSAYFGIVDLAGIPKDRYYLYRSQWSDEPTLHLLPHWNWEGTGIDHLPVFCYTNYNSAELFVNGKSQGVREKDPTDLFRRYRLIWDEVTYEPGQIKVVALDKQGNPAMEKVIHTAGEPDQLKLEADREMIRADGRDMVFVTLTVMDANGYFCPKASNEIRFRVEGAADLVTIGSGDQTSLERYGIDHRRAFNGKCVAYVRSNGEPGKITVTAYSDGLKRSGIELAAE